MIHKGGIRMDLTAIGTFIATLRKEHHLTQEQFGEQLGVTSKTVSRWETGKYLPPAEALQEMSTLFDVSINSLLSGQRLAEADYKASAEENLRDMLHANAFSYKEKLVYYKAKWKKEHCGWICLIYTLLSGLLIAGILTKQILLTVTAVVLFPIGYAWIQNTMMIYVEQRAFDGMGSEKKCAIPMRTLDNRRNLLYDYDTKD